MPEFIGSLDQGTTSTRFMVFDPSGDVVGSAQEEHRQILPRPGWVEHDPMEIWERTQSVIESALEDAGLMPADLAAVGITNQRETTVLWDPTTGEPVANAVVWQDTRTAEICQQLRAEGGPDRFRAKTGLPTATYFSAPKVRWLIEEHGLHAAAENGDLLFGTIDSWLTWKLTGRHVTDTTNASRSMLMNLETRDWDPQLCEDVGIPRSVLPEIVDSLGVIGECSDPLDGVPLAAILGDQHAAMFGQACFAPGEAKNTYGTGNFMLINTGHKPVPSKAGLITTVAYTGVDIEPVYALEGSIAVTGSLVQWLRDNLGLIANASEIEGMAAEVEDNGDVYFVPAFSGLFAPHWRPDARGVITGLTRFSNRGHIARAALESTAYQSRDVLEAMTNDSGVELAELRVDGGMTANSLLMQFQADILDVDVVRPKNTETTAVGAAFAAGLAVGTWKSFDDLRSLWSEDRRWHPAMDNADRARLTTRWSEALERSYGWV